MQRPVPLWSLILGSVVSLFVGIGLASWLRSQAPKETAATVPEPALIQTLGEWLATAKPAIVVQVFTTSSGMTAQSVEKAITRRLERWVNQEPGVARVESKSINGASLLTVYFRSDIDPDRALTSTNSLALGALPALPPGTLPPVVLPCDGWHPREIGGILKLLAEPFSGPVN